MRSTLDQVCGWALLCLVFRPVAYGIFVASASPYVSLHPSHGHTSVRFAACEAPQDCQHTVIRRLSQSHVSTSTVNVKCLVNALQDDSVRIMPKAWLPIPLQRALGFVIACAVTSAIIRTFPIFPAERMPERLSAFVWSTVTRLL